MKQFSLEEFKKNPNRKVVTRSGKPVKIIYTEAEGNYPVIGLISLEGGERPERFTENGKYINNNENDSDLFFTPENKEGYVNLYRSRLFSGMFQTSVHVLSKEVAEEEAAKFPEDFIATAKLTWEE